MSKVMKVSIDSNKNKPDGGRRTSTHKRKIRERESVFPPLTAHFQGRFSDMIHFRRTCQKIVTLSVPFKVRVNYTSLHNFRLARILKVRQRHLKIQARRRWTMHPAMVEWSQREKTVGHNVTTTKRSDYCASQMLQ